MLKLADRFQERLAFDIAYCASHLDNGDLCLIIIVVAVETALDLIGDVGDHLDSASAEVSPTFLLQDGPVDLSCGYVGVFCKAFINETFIMTQVKIGLRTVIGDKDFAVLNRIHGAGVNVDVGVEFLHGHFVASGLQQTAKGSCRNSFSQSGNNTARNKNVFYWHNGEPPFYVSFLIVWG